MPVRPDAPLRKVTLNLYEADCDYLQKIIGHGWSELVRSLVHAEVQQRKRATKPTNITLGDLFE